MSLAPNQRRSIPLVSRENDGENGGEKKQGTEAVSQNPFRIFLSSWPRRMENKMEPPIPISVAKEESRVIMGAHTPAPARESAPVTGMFPYINTVNDTVKDVDELCEHKRDRYPQYKAGYVIPSKSFILFCFCIHDIPSIGEPDINYT